VRLWVVSDQGLDPCFEVLIPSFVDLKRLNILIELFNLGAANDESRYVVASKDPSKG